jgi:hypothetical protein
MEKATSGTLVIGCAFSLPVLDPGFNEPNATAGETIARLARQRQSEKSLLADEQGGNVL